MSYSPWSNNPNAPKISRREYTTEKAGLAGSFISAIAYGMPAHVLSLSVLTLRVRSMGLGAVIILFFQCMNALLNPVNRAGGRIKWLLVTHTTAMFLFVTVFTGMYLNLQSISFIDNREFPGNATLPLPPGPLGYQHLIYNEPVSLVSRFMFMLNNWLADGLLVSSTFKSVNLKPIIGPSSSSIVAA
jgi:hypothetical protein